MPDRTGAIHQLSDGDQVFILDSNGNVVVGGFYGENDYQPTLACIGPLT